MEDAIAGEFGQAQDSVVGCRAAREDVGEESAGMADLVSVRWKHPLMRT
jgi:hypothetical protein